MKLFKCQSCGQVLYFENTRCERCGHRLGYLPDDAMLSALEPDGALWRPATKPDMQMRFCANAEYDACNWMVAAQDEQTFCLACEHNHIVPDLTVPQNVERWRKLEVAKHRLFYTMRRLDLPLRTRKQDPAHGLAFDFLADPPARTGERVMTGHDDGLITIALKEADDAEREKLRTQMGEPYRTLLGHFRHEVGHHFWDLLVRDGGFLEECRAVFGDDTRDYDEALQAHYKHHAPPDWREHYISAYATAHPWEDFAETWAHYLHMLDTLEMARDFGISVHPRIDAENAISTDIDFDPHRADIHHLVDAWLPLSFAVNSLNRSMGQPDFYPFVMSPAVVDKLAFIAGVIHRRRAD